MISLTSNSGPAKGKVGRHDWYRSGCFLVVLLWVSPSCFGGNVALLGSQRSHLQESETIRKLADFYGLQLKTAELDSPKEISRALALLKSPDTLAVLAAEDELSPLGQQQVEAAIRRSNSPSVPLLVFGVTAQVDARVLKAWSGGVIAKCAPLPGFRPTTMEAGSAGNLAGSLVGIKVPAVASPSCGLEFQSTVAGQTVVSAQSSDGTAAAVLVRVQGHAGERFFVPQMAPFDQEWIGDATGLPKAFSSMFPFILFLSHAAGDYAWHSDGHYANLTIDDAWLTQPYGHLDYSALLVEMEKHNFHTTIAFIPWNFNRSEPAVVTLFRAHPERFSICVHGNDHEHREFGDYALNPLRGQIADIKQGVARMERFHSLTGIGYDRFMVFPHGVAPEETFAALRTYEFLGTANFMNLPLGAKVPSDPTFLLRPSTVAYGGLLSLSRYSSSDHIPQAEIAIQSFLGNPVLLYGHESLFDSGITAFNANADFVNRVQPDTFWTSLGEIARHSYLLRRRSEGGFEVQMLSSEMALMNPGDMEATYYVRRATDTSTVSALTVDGNPVGFDRSQNELVFRLVIPAHQVSHVRVAFRNDLDLVHQDIGKSNVHAYLLRRVSDFRDLYLSRFSLGQSIKKAYYRNGWDGIERSLERKWWFGLGVVVVLLIASIRFRRRRATKRAAARAAVAR
jgi:hypothetical protein